MDRIRQSAAQGVSWWLDTKLVSNIVTRGSRALGATSGPIPMEIGQDPEGVLRLARERFRQENCHQQVTQGQDIDILYTHLYNGIITWSTATASIKVIGKIIQFLNMKTLPIYNIETDTPDLSLVLNKLRESASTRNISSELYSALTTYDTTIESLDWTDRLKRHGSNVVSFILVYIVFDWFIKPFTNWTITTLANTLKKYIDEKGLPIDHIITQLKLMLEKIVDKVTETTPAREVATIDTIKLVKDALCNEDDKQTNHDKIIDLFYKHSTSIVATLLVKICEGINKFRIEENRVNLFTLVKEFITESLSPSDNKIINDHQPASAILQGIRSMMFATFTQVSQLEVTTEKLKEEIATEETDLSQGQLTKTLRNLKSQEQLEPKEADIKATLIALLRSMHYLITLKADKKNILAAHEASEKFIVPLGLIAANQMPINLNGVYTFLADKCAPLITSTISEISHGTQSHHSIRILLLEQVVNTLSKIEKPPTKLQMKYDINILTQLTIKDLFAFMCAKLNTPSNEIVVAFDRVLHLLQTTIEKQNPTFNEATTDILDLCIAMEKNLPEITRTLSKTINSNKMEHTNSHTINEKLMCYTKYLTIHIAKQEIHELLALDNNDDDLSERIKDLSKFLSQHVSTITTHFDITSEYILEQLAIHAPVEAGAADTHATRIQEFKSYIELLKIKVSDAATQNEEITIEQVQADLLGLSEFFATYHNNEIYETSRTEILQSLTTMREQPRTEPKAQLPELLVMGAEAQKDKFQRFTQQKLDDLIELFQLDFLPEALIHALF
jgi:hypothetical protein